MYIAFSFYYSTTPNMHKKDNCDQYYIKIFENWW